MKRNELRVISEYMGVFPVNINSNLVSAQNRNRWYWTNIRTKKVGLFDEIWSDIPQPKDRGILLKDILQPEGEVDEKYYLSDKLLTGLLNHANNRNQNWTLNGSKGKAKAITVSHLKQNLDSNYVCVAMRGRNPENPSDRRTGSPTEQRLESKTDGKTNCLTSVAKDNLILSIGSVRMGRNEKAKQVRRENAKNGKDYSPFNEREITNIDFDKSDCLLASPNPKKDNLLTDGYKLRRLTPLECARLQTIPEWYEWIVSDTQQYKMLGNGWTVEVIKHILSFLNK